MVVDDAEEILVLSQTRQAIGRILLYGHNICLMRYAEDIPVPRSSCGAAASSHAAFGGGSPGQGSLGRDSILGMQSKPRQPKPGGSSLLPAVPPPPPALGIETETEALAKSPCGSDPQRITRK